jgi:tellurite resistance protein TerB
MALWDKLKERALDMTSQAKTQAGKHKNKEFADASMAVCALIAAADGTISAEERSRTAGFITSNDALSIFPATELLERFNHFAGKLESDYDFGKVEAVQALSKLKGKPDAARAVIQVGIIIGGADGEFDKNEMQAVRESCNAVGVAPSEFDL